MTNITQFIELHEKRRLMVECIHELNNYFSPEMLRIWKVFLLTLSGWMITVFAILLLSPFMPLKSRQPTKEIFFAEYSEKIRKNFPHQSEETFQTIFMGVNRILRKNTEDPTVLLLLAPQGAMPTAVRLVFQLVHSILAACVMPADSWEVKRVILDGSRFPYDDDEWPFFYKIRRHLKFDGVAAVLSFDDLHPLVVRSLQILLPQVNAPYPESVLILVVDLRNQFTEHQKRNLSPNAIGRMFLQDHFSPYFDNAELSETIKRLGCRCVLVNPDPVDIGTRTTSIV